MIKFLSTPTFQVIQAPNGTLSAIIEGDRCVLNLTVLKAFPLSHPTTNLVLRDGGGAEIGIVAELEGLAEPSRAFLQAALEKRYFLPKITAIHSIYERFGSSIWQVETDRGAITVQTKAMNESVSEIGPGRYLLRDNEENRFEIPNLAALDEESRSRFLGKV